MKCKECKKGNKRLYECSYCRNHVCEECCKNNEDVKCKTCEDKYNKGYLKETDKYLWLVTCEKCGNKWDGNAQCNCWEFEFDTEI